VTQIDSEIRARSEMGSARRTASSISTVRELMRFATAHRRRCLTPKKLSGSVRCTCNAGAGRKEAGQCARARRISTHRLETLLTQCSTRYPHPSAADPTLRAAGVGVGRRLRLRKEHRLRVSESSRALCLLRLRVLVLLAWLPLLLLLGSAACAICAAAATAFCPPAHAAVRRRAAQMACAFTSSPRASWL
jgi:hypothetical protein